MYYRLGANLNLYSGYMHKEDNYDETLMSGEKVNEEELTLPWPFSLASDESDQLELSDYYPGAELMSARLVETLRAAGVDNLQTFPAIVSDTRRDRRIDNYLVVNVIGLVSVANMSTSISRPLADVQFFESLTIDPAKALDLLMFRLAESRGDVIVSERVAKRIQEGRFIDVTLEPLAEATDT